MKVSSYDRDSGFLTAMLILVGSGTLLLALIWLGQAVTVQPAQPRFTAVDSPAGDSGTGSDSSSWDVDEPGADELPMAAIPPTDLLQSLVGLTEVSLSFPEGFVASNPGTDGEIGPGGKRKKGSAQNPVWASSDWELQFQALTIEDYARQLDFFGIELAVVGGGKSEVEYASEFTAKTPVVRKSDGRDETRRYLLWRKGPLVNADRTLLTRAGISHEGRVILKFVSPDVERQMAALENERAKSARRTTGEVKKTVFAIEGTPGNYRFVVIDQRYRF